MSDKLTIKEQLLLVRDKCPDLWIYFSHYHCPSYFDLKENNNCKFEGSNIEECSKCWNEAVEGKYERKESNMQ